MWMLTSQQVSRGSEWDEMELQRWLGGKDLGLTYQLCCPASLKEAEAISGQVQKFTSSTQTRLDLARCASTSCPRAAGALEHVLNV